MLKLFLSTVQPPPWKNAGSVPADYHDDHKTRKIIKG